MRAVVTGATSFLGAALIRRLLEEGHQVYAVVRPYSANRKVLPENVPGLWVLELDMERLLEIPGQIGERCEVYFHFAWDGSGSVNRKRQEIQEKNAKDSVNALKGARALGCRRFFFSGSQAEYGQCKDRMREGQECRPISWYGLSKTEFYRQAQKLCRGWKDEGKETLEYIHARIFSVYGPGTFTRIALPVCRRMPAASRPVLVTNRSSPTSWILSPSLSVSFRQPSQSSSCRPSSMETIGYFSHSSS